MSEPAPQQRRMIRLTLEYDGTAYAGWQRQANATAVQQVLEEALERLLGHSVRVTASGRTDAGVHAACQVVSLPTTAPLPADAIGRAVNTLLPPDIVVTSSCEAAEDFDARRDARLRWYRFFLCNRAARPAIGERYLTHIWPRLDMDAMRAAADVLAGRHDFQAFRSSACTATRTRLTLMPIEIAALPDDVIRIDYRCRSFLHNMVRILTGTLVAAGKGKLAPDDVRHMLATGERHVHAVTVPPNGLFLYRVYYEGEVPEKWGYAAASDR